MMINYQLSKKLKSLPRKCECHRAFNLSLAYPTKNYPPMPSLCYFLYGLTSKQMKQNPCSYYQFVTSAYIENQ